MQNYDSFWYKKYVSCDINCGQCCTFYFLESIKVYAEVDAAQKLNLNTVRNFKS